MPKSNETRAAGRMKHYCAYTTAICIHVKNHWHVFCQERAESLIIVAGK